MQRLTQPAIRTAKMMFIVLLLIGAGPACAQEQSDNSPESTDKWAAFRPLIGKWSGEGKTPAGPAEQHVEWKLIMNETYLQCISTSRAEGDDHQDIGMISYDSQRQKFIYRSFLSEGFVNQYVAEINEDENKITFVSESIENGPESLKAMEALELRDDELHTTLSLASGDGPWKVCVTGKLKRTATDKR